MSYPPAPQMPQSQPYGAGPQYGAGEQAEYYNQQQQPGGYQQQQQPYGGYSGDAKNSALAPEGYEGERFAPKKPKFNDPIFAILFLLVFGGYVAVSVIALRGYVSSPATATLGKDTGIGATLNGHTAVLLMFTSAVALFFSIVYIFLVKTFTTVILEVTLALSVLTSIAYAVYLWVKGQTSGAIVATIFAVLGIVSYFFMRKRIPLAKLMLKAIIRASNEYKSTYVIALIGTLVQTAVSVWFSWTVVAIYVRFSPQGVGRGSSASSGAVTGLIVFTAFAYYWTSEMVKAIAFTTVSGVYGVWFYTTGPKPAHAALSSFKRSMTTSFGSLAFGSLILAILDIIRAALQIFQSQQASEGDAVAAALACVAGCLIGCVDYLVTFFNRLAYVNIALYGNGYVTAAKETWTLVKAKGIDALINDSLVNTVFTFGAYIVALFSGIFCYAYLSLTSTGQSYVDANPNYFSAVMLYSIILSLQICLAMGSGSIGAGVTTFFVALSEDPAHLARKEPILFEALRQAYPQVVNALPSS